MPATPSCPEQIGVLRYLLASNFEDSITAFSGGGQSGAYALSAQLSRVSTVGAGADSVSLPKITARDNSEANPGQLGFIAIVRNDGANSMQVFGATPDTINSVATGTGVAVGAGKSAIFFAQSYVQSTNVGNWVMVLSA